MRGFEGEDAATAIGRVLPVSVEGAEVAMIFWVGLHLLGRFEAKSRHAWAVMAMINATRHAHVLIVAL